ncbi:hypothetical protein Cgig2_023860 [Carnegiea gigantea]|uniref:Uncharacterized protein n=1 Tax=Carnegiea gigantea TaxID=171969 RepID=A0A9Q1GS15_9CARY|nr:hypothetical protein Cgig2_023860 [Carnegiea gigantea]
MGTRPWLGSHSICGQRDGRQMGAESSSNGVQMHTQLTNRNRLSPAALMTLFTPLKGYPFMKLLMTTLNELEFRDYGTHNEWGVTSSRTCLRNTSGCNILKSLSSWKCILASKGLKGMQQNWIQGLITSRGIWLSGCIWFLWLEESLKPHIT